MGGSSDVCACSDVPNANTSDYSLIIDHSPCLVIYVCSSMHNASISEYAHICKYKASSEIRVCSSVRYANTSACSQTINSCSSSEVCVCSSVPIANTSGDIPQTWYTNCWDDFREALLAVCELYFYQSIYIQLFRKSHWDAIRRLMSIDFTSASRNITPSLPDTKHSKQAGGLLFLLPSIYDWK